MVRASVVILSLVVPSVIGAQTAEVHDYGTVHQHAIRSTANHATYHLFVSLPSGYSASDTTRYPVLYALDGNDSFPLIQAVRRFLQAGGAIPRIIIVGIGYPDSTDDDVRRQLDLTPTPQRLNPTSNVVTGGAPAFLQTLRLDVIPFIDTRYRTRGDRALVGHSYGGLFGLYVLYTAPELFARYGIFSPSTWWDQHRLLDQIAQHRPTTGQPAARVFVAVGADEDAAMRTEADSVAAILTRVYGSRLTLTNRQCSGNHVSYFPEALSPGLAFLYPDSGAAGCLGSLPIGAGQLYVVRAEPEQVEIERFVRGSTDVWGRVFQTGGACFKYRLTLDPAGRGIAARLEQSLGAPRTAGAEVHASRVHFRTTEPTQERSVDALAPTALYVPLFVGALEQLVRLAPSRVGDSTRVLLANFRRAEMETGVIIRLAPDSISIWHPNFQVRVHVSDQLAILGGTTTPTGAGSVATRWALVRQP